MRKVANIFTVGIILICFSCSQPISKKYPLVSEKDTTSVDIKDKKQESKEKRKEREWNKRTDSVQFDMVLREAVQLARKNSKSDNFYKEYEQSVDSLFNTTVNLTIGYLFSKTKKHLIIRRTAPWAVVVNIYLINGNDFRLVVNHEQSGMTYINDTIRDINGDGDNDSIVNWYGSSGCCLKGFSNVYLYKAGKGIFTGDYEFINPTFSPNEKVVRGICYGHPGETEMYKYKWNKEKVDTIAYIYYEKDKSGVKTGKVIQSNRLPYDDRKAVIKKLNKVPKEFTEISGYDWFTGDY